MCIFVFLAGNDNNLVVSRLSAQAEMFLASEQKVSDIKTNMLLQGAVILFNKSIN
jgi:hypothetical protein